MRIKSSDERNKNFYFLERLTEEHAEQLADLRSRSVHTINVWRDRYYTEVTEHTKSRKVIGLVRLLAAIAISLSCVTFLFIFLQPNPATFIESFSLFVSLILNLGVFTSTFFGGELND